VNRLFKGTDSTFFVTAAQKIPLVLACLHRGTSPCGVFAIVRETRKGIANPQETHKEKTIMKRILATLFVVTVIYAAASTAHAQWPGAGNPWPGRPAGVPPGANRMPPTFPGQHEQEKRRDQNDPLHYIHIIGHGMPHSHHPSAAPTAEQMKNMHKPIVVPPETNFPVSDLRYTPPRFTPVMNEGIPSMARGFSHFKGGGILATIGGGIAALFGGLFGRRKDS
jgi:hypothetical protein